jgi:uncharacterized protein
MSDLTTPIRRKWLRRAITLGLLLALLGFNFSRILSYVLFTDFRDGNLAPQSRIVSEVRTHITLTGVNGNRIPMLLEIPPDGTGIFPVVILYSGHGGTKEQVLNKFAPFLVSRGIAALAVDLATHGEKSNGRGTFFDDLSPDGLLTIAEGIRESVIDGKRAVSWAQEQHHLDSGQIAIMGESLGSYVALIHAANDSRIRALVLNVLGAQHKATDIEGSWLLRFKRPFLPIYQAARISDCPVLMLNGRNDATVSPDGSRMLYAALPAAKDIVWFDSGHELPLEAREVASSWIAEHFQRRTIESPR